MTTLRVTESSKPTNDRCHVRSIPWEKIDVPTSTFNAAKVKKAKTGNTTPARQKHDWETMKKKR